MKDIMWGMIHAGREGVHAMPYWFCRRQHIFRECFSDEGILDSFRNFAVQKISCVAKPACSNIDFLVATVDRTPRKKYGCRNVTDAKRYYRDYYPFD